MQTFRNAALEPAGKHRAGPAGILIRCKRISYPVKWLDQKIARAYLSQEQVRLRNIRLFLLSASSGFGDRDNFLGGRVRLDRTNVLYVTSNRRIYLRGATRDVYTGNRWINSVDGLSPLDEDPGRLYSDTDEMIEGLKLLTGSDELPDGLLDGSSITVTFLNLKTKSLFVPPKIISFEPETADITAYISDTGDISSKNRLERFPLQNDPYVPATASELFRETLSKAGRPVLGYLDEIDSILRSTRLTPRTIRIPSGHLEIGSELPDIPRSESTDH